MKYCKNCGAQLEDAAMTCDKCGAAQEASGQTGSAVPEVVDKGGFLWGLLGCCIPIVGLILFLVWKDSKPKTAKAAGIGALVSVIIAVVYYVIVIVAGVAFGVMA